MPGQSFPCPVEHVEPARALSCQTPLQRPAPDAELARHVAHRRTAARQQHEQRFLHLLADRPVLAGLHRATTKTGLEGLPHLVVASEERTPGIERAERDLEDVTTEHVAPEELGRRAEVVGGADDGDASRHDLVPGRAARQRHDEGEL